MPKRLVLLLCVACTLVVDRSVRADDEPAFDQVLARMAAYAAQFRRQLSAMVVEETYEQKMRTTFGGQILSSNASAQVVDHRELKSDVLMVRLAAQDGYIEFRDVFEVDGRAVRDREERLLALFLTPHPDVNQQLERILSASARYNIGSVIRTINTPAIPMMFIEAEFQPRFTFARAKERSISSLGIEKARDVTKLWTVEYHERARSTLIQRPNGLGDLPTQGRFWVDPQTGHVRMTELRIEDPIIATIIDVVYDVEPSIGQLVPVEMRERYHNRHDGTVIEGYATYGRFRRFGVSTDEKINTPKPRP